MGLENYFGASKDDMTRVNAFPDLIEELKKSNRPLIKKVLGEALAKTEASRAVRQKFWDGLRWVKDSALELTLVLGIFVGGMAFNDWIMGPEKERLKQTIENANIAHSKVEVLDLSRYKIREIGNLRENFEKIKEYGDRNPDVGKTKEIGELGQAYVQITESLTAWPSGIREAFQESVHTLGPKELFEKWRPFLEYNEKRTKKHRELIEIVNSLKGKTFKDHYFEQEIFEKAYGNLSDKHEKTLNNYYKYLDEYNLATSSGTVNIGTLEARELIEKVDELDSQVKSEKTRLEKLSGLLEAKNKAAAREGPLGYEIPTVYAVEEHDRNVDYLVDVAPLGQLHEDFFGEESVDVAYDKENGKTWKVYIDPKTGERIERNTQEELNKTFDNLNDLARTCDEAATRVRIHQRGQEYKEHFDRLEREKYKHRKEYETARKSFTEKIKEIAREKGVKNFSPFSLRYLSLGNLYEIVGKEAVKTPQSYIDKHCSEVSAEPLAPIDGATASYREFLESYRDPRFLESLERKD